MCHNPGVDNALLSVIAVVGSAVLIAVAAWVVSGYRQRKLVQDAREWIATEATINSGTLESMQESSKVVLPTFAFSYQVSGQHYSGKFSLMPKKALFSSEARRAFIESMIEGMIGRNFRSATTRASLKRGSFQRNGSTAAKLNRESVRT